MIRLLIALVLPLAAAGVHAEGGDPGAPRQLVEQKIRLLEMLVHSSAAKSVETGSAERLTRARQAVAAARRAMADDRPDEAGRVVDEALRSSSPLRRGLPEPSLSDDALRRAHQNLIEQVATYRAAIEDLAPHAKLGAAARILLTRIDGKSAEARKAAGNGRLDQANRLLGEAYQWAVSELARLRAGDEVILSLNFSSPADEYAYEVRRFDSNQILVAMMVQEGKADGERRAVVDQCLDESRRRRAIAEQQAGGGFHREAVASMEAAVAQLNRALQTMGVPAF